MSNNKYFIKTGGLNEFTLNPNVDDTSSDINMPTNSPLSEPEDVKVVTPNIVGMAVKGTATSTTAKGEVPPKSALAGYAPVDNEKKNSEIVDKTPDNSELNDPSKLKNDEPSTEEKETHPHQIQSGEVNKEHETETDIATSPNAELPNPDGVVDIEVDEKTTPEHEIKPELNEGMNDFKNGLKAKISGGSGIDSGKVVTVVDKSNIVTTGHGTPSNVKGAYKPVDWSKEVAIQYDDGSFGTMYKNRLSPVSWSSGASQEECKDCGCGKPNLAHDAKIEKLQSLHETLSKKPFLTMKEVMLMNEAKKILSSKKK